MKNSMLNVIKSKTSIILAVLIFTSACSESDVKEEEDVLITQSAASTTSNNQETIDHSPDPQKLEEIAEVSSDLYVEEGFNFNITKQLIVDLNVTDEFGLPMANKTIFLSAVPNDVSALEELNRAEKSLIAVFRTDAAGQIYKAIEVPQQVQNMLVEVNALGIENSAIIAVTEPNLLTYQFK